MDLKIGVAFGSQNSPSALCLVEIQKSATDEGREGPARAVDLMKTLMDEEPVEEEILKGPALTVNRLEQFPAGTRMVEMASRLREILQSERDLHREGQVTIYLNVTGKGEPLLDMFKEKLPGYNILPVYLTRGERLQKEALGFTIGILLLVTKVTLLFELMRLHLSPDFEAEVLKNLVDSSLEADPHWRPSALLVALGLTVFEPGVGLASRTS